MQFESQWPGDAIAAPFWPEHDRQDLSFEDLGGRSSNRIENRENQADAELRTSQGAAVSWGIRHNQLVRLQVRPNPWGPRIAGLTRRVLDLLIEGCVLSAATLHPEFFPLGEHAHRRDFGRDHPDGLSSGTRRADFAVWRARLSSIIRIVVELWSKMRRERQIRRLSAGWERIDDRTLKDIGISRCEIEYAGDARIGVDAS
jgi:uncharacterized protein YjiS (DUF1127 family)